MPKEGSSPTLTKDFMTPDTSVQCIALKVVVGPNSIDHRLRLGREIKGSTFPFPAAGALPINDVGIVGDS